MIEFNDECVHCSTPLPPKFEGLHGPGDEPWTKTALKSIFKLNYLKILEEKDYTTGEKMNELKLHSVCLNCSQTLGQLFRLYNDFLQLGNMNGYLSRQIYRLDNIIDGNHSKQLYPDLRNETEDNFDESLFDDAISTHSFNMDTHVVCPSESNNNSSQLTTTTTTDKGMDPRVVLTRLPQKYLKVVKEDEQQFPVIEIKQELLDDIEEEVDNDDAEDADWIQSKWSQQKSNKRRLEEEYSKLSSRSSTRPKKQPKRTNISKFSEPNSSRAKSKNSKNTSKTKSTPPPTLPIRRVNQQRKNAYYARRFNHPCPCWYCNIRDFATPAECYEHTKKEHLPNFKLAKAVVCPRCARICSTQGDYENHLKKCELIPSGQVIPKKFPCPNCDKSFGCNSRLKSHIETVHREDRPYQCDKCPYSGKVSSALRVHIQLKHTEQAENDRKCDICNTVLKNSLSLKFHKWRLHTDEGKIKYKIMTKKAYERKKKKKKVKPPLPTICEDCNIDFFSRLALINHRRTAHADNMCKFFCEKCPAGFTTFHSLVTHTKRHSEERPWICEHCGKGFKVKTNLTDHVEHTHDEEGRLKYNEKTRIRNQRRKFLASQLANLKTGQGEGTLNN